MADNQLNVSIGAEISGLQKGLDKAKQELSGFDAKVKSIGKLGDEFISVGKGLSAGLTAPIVGLGVAIGKVANDFVDFSTRLISSADQAGLTTESYQELTFALSQYGISNTDAERTLGRLNQRIGLALEGNEKYAGSLQALGVSLTNNQGQLKATEDVFLDIAQSLSEIENPAQRAALASDFFGVNLSRRLLPALSDGEDGISAFIDKAHELGVVMGDEQLREAEAFGTAINNLKLQFSTATREIGSAFIPLLTDTLIPAIQNTLIPAVQNLSDRIKSIVSVFQNMPSGLQKGILAFGGIAAAIGPVTLALGGVMKIIPMVITGIKGIGAAMTFATGPIGLVVLGLTAIGVAVYKNWDKIKPYIIDTINWFIDLYNESTVVRAGVQAIVTEFKIGFAVVSNVLKTAWEVIKSFAYGVAESFKGVGDIIKGAFTGNWDAVKSGFGQIQRASSEMGAMVVSDLTQGFKNATKEVESIFWDGVEKVHNPGKLKRITDLAFSGLKENVEENVSKQVSEGIQSGFAKALNIIEGVTMPKMELPFSEDMMTANLEDITKSIELMQNAMSEAELAQMESNLRWMELGDELTDILHDGMVNGISGAFEAVGRALAEGKNVIQAFGKSMMSAMGSLMQQFGKAMIGWGIAKVAIDQLFKSANPYLVAAAGAALVALGAAVSSTSAKTQSSLSSNPPGSGSISSGTGSGFSTPSTSGVSGATGGVQRYVFEIEGQKLVGVLSNTLDRNSKLANDIRL